MADKKAEGRIFYHKGAQGRVSFLRKNLLLSFLFRFFYRDSGIHTAGTLRADPLTRHDNNVI
jgi:hypothetical protein